MENIFEGARFGDKFKTSDGEMAIYDEPSAALPDLHWLLTKNGHERWCSNGNGYSTPCSIVGRWEEEQNVVSVDKACEEFEKFLNIRVDKTRNQLRREDFKYWIDDFRACLTN